MFTFEWDSRDLEVWRGGKVDAAIARSLRLAGNRALRSMQRGSTARVRSKKLMREEHVVRGLPLVFPGRKMAIRHLAWVMKVSGEPVPISRFPHIQTPWGVAFRVNVGGGTKRIKSAFPAVLDTGHRGVFMRHGPYRRASKGNYRGQMRQAVRELWTTRISDTMRDPGTIDAVHADAVSRMRSDFQRGLDRELAKLRRKGEV